MGWSQSWFDVDVSASICQYDTGPSIISAMVLFCNGLWTSNMVVDPNMGLWNYGFRLPLSRTAFIVYIEDPRVTHPAVRERCGAHQADREPARAASVLPESLRRAIRLRACSAIRRKETMRTFSATTLTGAVLTSLLFSATAFAHEHVALNGTGTLVPAQSDFAGHPVIQTGTVTINQREMGTSLFLAVSNMKAPATLSSTVTSPTARTMPRFTRAKSSRRRPGGITTS